MTLFICYFGVQSWPLSAVSDINCILVSAIIILLKLFHTKLQKSNSFNYNILTVITKAILPKHSLQYKKNLNLVFFINHSLFRT